ncbi:uncharacterized protein P884DRAFT_269238 [Thermothelomyces heterothallicus CBS 202.75]|uniref:uncharacterized protein n=1 Tax=Thermothelomyces heterothallicus CBS 202.75 TaxID=1149848 RepID=UPI0037429E6D
MALRWRRLLLLTPSLFRPLSLRRRCGVAEKEASCFRSVDLPPPAVAEGTSERGLDDDMVRRIIPPMRETLRCQTWLISKFSPLSLRLSGTQDGRHRVTAVTSETRIFTAYMEGGISCDASDRRRFALWMS